LGSSFSSLAKIPVVAEDLNGFKGASDKETIDKHGDPVSRKAQAAARIKGVANNVNGLVTRGTLSRTEGNMVRALAAWAEGVVAFAVLDDNIACEDRL
jgi:hypothetical protein